MRSSFLRRGIHFTLAAFLLAATSAIPQARAQSGRVFGFDKDLIHQDPDGSFYLSDVDRLRVLEIMEEADVLSLGKILQQLKQSTTDTPLTKVFEARLARAALMRISGDFKGSNEELDKLTAALGMIKGAQGLITPLGLIVAIMRTGNLYLDGDIHAWAVALDDMHRQYFEPVRASYHMPDLAFRNMSQLELAVAPDSIPEQSVELSAEETIPFWQSTRMLNGRQQIDTKGRVTADGEKTDAVFDTAAIEMAVSVSFARRHNLRTIAKTEQLRDSENRSPFATTDYVMVPSLHIGDTVFHNQIASISRSNTPVIIGLQQLLKLPNVTFSKTGMTFGFARSLNCHGPMVIAALRSGQQAWLLGIVTLNGSQDFAIMNTGNNATEIMTINTPSLTPSLRKHAYSEDSETIAGPGQQFVAVENTSIAFGSQQIMAPVGYRQTRSKRRSELTTALLNYGNIEFDRNHKTFCIDLQTTAP
ncbi:aspartyl protease family protein [Acetobacter sp.]|jgi:hypothetical protein|uniref:aspartyl protease family protein n=1 Tax=Acetobacter sp. TaxID=440 RepID=UPI0025C6D6FB|nr:aspartyl protease family protein [Acetobacter sp.]MCH4090208.1 retropepsin-like domain-containing protein [Acetobacter sp.]MCI1298902.1 retropepsin-like domain-containing protein [Acetobacter sp.]MCI1314922.1 retropepsin-like domain-containing protein [Acetobacter sp.]